MARGDWRVSLERKMGGGAVFQIELDVARVSCFPGR